MLWKEEKYLNTVIEGDGRTISEIIEDQKAFSEEDVQGIFDELNRELDEENSDAGKEKQ